MTIRNSAPARPKTAGLTGDWMTNLLRRIHFYAGIFIAPFIFCAAASGALYALAPSLEKVIYAQELTAPSGQNSLSLEEQIQAARTYLGDENAAPAAVRPAPVAGETSRIIFTDENAGEGERRAVFVDPGSGQVRGELLVYGTSGSLPLRTWISKFHSGALLGSWGRYYSELAASWMWVLTLTGLLMLARTVWKSSSRTRQLRRILAPGRKKGYLGSLGKHRVLGLWIALFMLFFSATGITWSQLGGAHVTDMRAAFGWDTPAVTKTSSLAKEDESASETHAHHQGGQSHAPAVSEDNAWKFDQVLETARATNIEGQRIEIMAPAAGQNWIVKELPSTLPTQADSVALDPNSLEVVDTVEFTDYPLMAKFARWGVDFHMGIMFGLVNQLILLVFALILCTVVVLGYRMWFQRRPRLASHASREQDAGKRPLRIGAAPARGSFAAAPLITQGLLLALFALISWFLPLFGLSLLVFLAVDIALVARVRSGGEARS